MIYIVSNGEWRADRDDCRVARGCQLLYLYTIDKSQNNTKPYLIGVYYYVISFFFFETIVPAPFYRCSSRRFPSVSVARARQYRLSLYMITPQCSDFWHIKKNRIKSRVIDLVVFIYRATGQYILSYRKPRQDQNCRIRII